MAGLLAGNVLRRFNPVIYEAQSELPNNHAALLRFRTDIASVATHIPFKKVKVQKVIDCLGQVTNVPNLKYSNMYSKKVTGSVLSRSINNLDTVERYIAPPLFIPMMATGLNIKYGEQLKPENLEFMKGGKSHPTISTIPMNIMMDLVGWKKKPEFKYHEIWSIWGEISSPEIDVYQTAYYPHEADPFYRISITGNQFIAEYIKEPDDNFDRELTTACCQTFGFSPKFKGGNLEIKHQKYGKLLPIDEKVRKEFIAYLTSEYNIYSLGRFATWRQLLLDDIVKDLIVIEKLIEDDSEYGRKMVERGIR